MESHVVRFVEHMPSAITALSPTPYSSLRPYLAVARANGDIELRLPTCAYFVERVIPGGENRSVSSLAWSQQSVLTDPDFYDDMHEQAIALNKLALKTPRLFSASLNGYITEWNLDSLKPLTSIDATGSGVWCIAVNPSGTLLAAGCDDGCIRLYDIADNEFTLVRTFHKQKCRVLCLAWHPSGDFLVSGGNDSTIRKWNVSTGASIDRATVERSSRKHQTTIWTILVLPDSTIVSGNSIGRIEFWDWNTTTLIQSINAHDSDIRSITASRAGSEIYSASVDRRIQQYKMNTLNRWVVAHSRTYHCNDVISVCVVECKSDSLVMDLCSGGVDSEVIKVSISNTGFNTSIQVRMDEFQVSRISAAPLRNVFLARFETSLKLFQLGTCPIDQMHVPLAKLKFQTKLDIESPPKLLAELQLCKTSNIHDAVISHDGAWIAVAHMDTVKLWNIDYGSAHDSRELSVVPVKSPLPALRQLVLVALRHEDSDKEANTSILDPQIGGCLLAGVDCHNHVQLYHLPPSCRNWSPRHIVSFPHHAGEFVVHVSLSPSCRYLASTDARARTFVVDLWSAQHVNKLDSTPTSPLADSTQFRVIHIPQLWPLAITSLQFASTSEIGTRPIEMQEVNNVEYLITTVSNKDFHIYSAPDFIQHEWTKTNMSRIAQDVRGRHEYLQGACLPNNERILLWSTGWILAFDLTRNLVSLNKRKQEDTSDTPTINCGKSIDGRNGNCGYKFLSIYKDMMHMQVLAPNRLLVVDRPWLDIAMNLPPAFQKKKYGM